MTDAALAPVPHRHFNLRRILVFAASIGLLWLAVWLLGWDVFAWFTDLWDTMTGISLGYIVAGCAMQLVQTTAIAYAWVPILRYAYPDAVIPFRSVLAAYAIGVALNGFLPANIGALLIIFFFLVCPRGSPSPGPPPGSPAKKFFSPAPGTLVTK